MSSKATRTTKIHDNIKDVLGKSGYWTEIRYHKKASHVLGVLKGEVSEMSSKHYEGAGLRVLVNGTWGFASTGDTTTAGLTTALKKAEEMALQMSSRKKRKISIAASKNLAVGDYFLAGYEELEKLTWEEKFLLVKNTEGKLRKTLPKLKVHLVLTVKYLKKKLL